jgi:hydroxymethylglutaryl-CoA lyase
MAERVIINDVGPRDGLQNQPRVLEPAQRLRLIAALLQAGLRHIEVAAFVSPKVVPAMGGAAEIMAGLPATPGAVFTALIPNMKGYELATAAGARNVSMVLYGTDSMAQANARMDSAAAEDMTADILARAREDGVRVSAYASVAFECPFDGPVGPGVVMGMSGRLLEAGADEVVVADTIGAATPRQVLAMMAELIRGHGPERLSCHFHDTRAMGLANVFAAAEAGIRKFDASIGRLGGCPFAPGASGNVATEDVAMMLAQMGFETGIDPARLLQAAAVAQELTGNAPGGRARAWLERQVAVAPSIE